MRQLLMLMPLMPCRNVVLQREFCLRWNPHMHLQVRAPGRQKILASGF
jgi:hypothetical protein